MTNATPGRVPDGVRSLLMLDEDAVLNLPDPEWLIKDTLVRNSFAALWGPSGSAKSFVALDWCLSVSRGIDWLGRPVVQGGSIYVAGEGVGGLPKRVRAWQEAHPEVASAGFHVMPDSIDLLRPEDSLALLESICVVDMAPELIVIDTLARSYSGDENSASEVGRTIRHLDRLRRVTGATVLVVHHSGKDQSADERGSSALRGAVDTSMSLRRESDGSRSLRCAKQKEAPEFSPLSMRLVVAEPVGSCYLEVAPDRDTKLHVSSDRDRLLDLLRVSPEPLTATSIGDAFKWNHRKARTVLDELLADGHPIETVPGLRPDSPRYLLGAET